MCANARRWLVLAAVLIAVMASHAAAQRRGFGGAEGIYKARIEPHWIEGGPKFWYQNSLVGGKREFIFVDAEQGKRESAFDHERLAAALKEAGVADARGDRLPLEALEFKLAEQAIEFRAGEKNWRCDLRMYQLSELKERQTSSATTPPPPRGGRGGQPQRGFGGGRGGRGGGGGSERSPDGKWTASIKESNVFIRAADGGSDIRLTTDGREGLAYGMLEWSPDSKRLVAFRIEPAERKEVHVVESSPRGGGRAVLHTRPYALPGDKFTAYEPHVFDIAAQQELPCKVDRIDFGRPGIRWGEDGDTFTYQQVDRGHQRLRLVETPAPGPAAISSMRKPTRSSGRPTPNKLASRHLRGCKRATRLFTLRSATAGGTCIWSIPRRGR